MNKNIGLVCGLTDEKPSFEIECKDYNPDSKEIEYVLQRKLAATGRSNIGDKADFRKNKELGLIICCVGIVITLISYTYADSLGFSIFAYGAIFYGGLQYNKGLQQEKIFKAHQEKEEKNKNNSD